MLLVFVLLVLFAGLVGTGGCLGGRLDLAFLRRRLLRWFLSSGCARGAFGSGLRRALLSCGVAIGGFVARLSKDAKHPSISIFTSNKLIIYDIMSFFANKANA